MYVGCKRRILAPVKHSQLDLFLFFCGASTRFRIMASRYESPHSHSWTQHTQKHSSGWLINPIQIPLPGNTQHSQQTNIHSPLRDSNPRSQQMKGKTHALDGHWDRLKTTWQKKGNQEPAGNLRNWTGNILCFSVVLIFLHTFSTPYQ